MTNLWQKSPPDLEIQLLRGELADGEWTLPDSGYRAFVFLSGSGVVRVAGGEVSFAAPCLIWLQAKRGTKLRIGAGSRGISLSVSEISFARAVGMGPNAQAIREALSHSLLVVKLEPKQARRLADNVEDMLDESLQEWPGMDDAVRHRLALFLIGAWRLSGPVMRESQPLPRTIMHRFLHAVELHLRDHWTIARYAEEVGVTAERLNVTVRRVAGRSPLAIIHARLVEEAISLLEGSSLPVAEIAETLGFQDPAYFSRFFKRETGRSPNKHRQHSALRAHSRHSFAAWP
ncbi:helix-turn-helix domain-containing protein [Chelativorans sp. J32]|uniref:helix-turn-helix domain-containing protein n=1 Tax=Chelativorans sp. J32 TaxID=935840 RepID=UPI0004AEF98B|nr:helix-turn-helix domain-containing protein [Chelativorans sp. J32]